MPPPALDAAVRQLRAVSDPTRLRLVRLLSEGELTVTELTQILGQSQPRVSRHLRLLLDAGLIERLPEGAWTFYRLVDERTAQPAGGFARNVVAALDAEDPLLASDRERLDQVKEARAAEASAYFEAHAAEWVRISSLYQPVAEVDRAMLDLLGAEPVDLLLDLGTGTGRVLEVLGPLYRRGIGVDLNREMLRLARVNLDRAGIRHAHVQTGNILSLPAVDSADLVVIHQVLHYLDNPAAAIWQAAGLVAPEGRLLVVDFLRHDIEALRTEHAHRRLGFTDDEIRSICMSAGLALEATRTLPPSSSEGRRVRPAVSLWLARKPRTAAEASEEKTA